MIASVFGQLNVVTVVLLLSSILLVLFYQLIWRHWNYFNVRNVRFYRGVPILGSLYKMLIGKEAFATVLLQLYRRFPDQRFFGLYELMHPVYVIRDPELIKQITVQDFEHFVNHQGNFDDEIDSLLARTLFFSRNQYWKEMRAILSPAFTGNRMRLMHGLAHDCSAQFLRSLKADAATNPAGRVYECKDLFTRYTCNAIATCAFGLNVDAIANRDDDFYLAGKKVTSFDGWQGIKFLLFDTMPTLLKTLRVKFFDPKLMEYFRSVVISTVKYRDENSVSRPDMIHLLMQARKGTLDENVAPRMSKGKNSAQFVGSVSLIFFSPVRRLAGRRFDGTMFGVLLCRLRDNVDVAVFHGIRTGMQSGRSNETLRRDCGGQ